MTTDDVKKATPVDILIENIVIPPERQLQHHPLHERLVDSILHLGVMTPIIVTECSRVLLKGLGRYRACRALKMTYIPAILIPDAEAARYKLLVSHSSKAVL